MPGLPHAVVKERAARLRSLAHTMREDFLSGRTGAVVKVAVEELRSDGVATGMAGPFFPVRFETRGGPFSRLIDVRCLTREGDGFTGEIPCGPIAM